jgi:6-phosphogluconate dehydrogenase
MKQTTHVGIIGLGKMGGAMRERMRSKGLAVTGYDPNPKITDLTVLADLVHALPTPRTIWVMVPSDAVTNPVITDLGPLLSTGDLVIDGGNNGFTDAHFHGAALAERGVCFVDAGVSGGIWGRDNGYGLMAGGENGDVQRTMPISDALRPDGPRDEGFVHAGPVGAEHYVKMVHNGIEYGLMQAWAEGYELLDSRKDLVKNVSGSFKACQRGTVVRSWLLELLAKALEEDPDFADIAGYVEDSGEGRWTLHEALNQAVAAPTISAAIFARFVSRQEDSPSMKAVAALRSQFGGHSVRKT